MVRNIRCYQWVPHIQKEIDFCVEITSMVKALQHLDYADHVKYLEQKII
jgi:hypothetical protein